LCIIIVFFSTNLTVRLDGWLNNSLILLSTQLRWYCAFKYVCLRGRSYINTCRSYMWPVCTPASLATYLPSAHMCGRFVRFWASGEWSSPKWEIPCLGRQWTVMQNLTLLALSSVEKSLTIQRHKQKTDKQ